MYRLLSGILLAGAVFAQAPKYKLGRAAAQAEIDAADISIAPDGTGLPPGSGTVEQGRDVYKRRCEKCHGANGAGADEAPLAGGKGSLATPKPLKTVGSYWPHATTIFDYVRRAMPFNQPGMLTNDQVYAVTAHILFLNGIIKESDVMNAKTLPQVKMPNREGFIADTRPDTGTRKGKK
jgi:cytochrome c